MYERIRNLREDNDLSQADVAKILHCSQQAYSSYERGKRGMPIELYIKLADFYKTSIDYIVGRVNKK